MVIFGGIVMVKEYLEKYKEEIKKCIDDLKHRDTIYKQVPNMLTFSRAIGMIPVNILLLTGNIGLGIGLIGALLVTDFFDGRIARKWNIQSKFGADLDAVCDKLMFLGLALPLMLGNPMLITNFILEGVISYINVLGRMKGLDTKTVFAGKIKTCFLSLALFVGYLVQFFGVSSTLFSVLTSMTFGAQVMTIYTYTKEYNNMKLNKKVDEETKINIELSKEEDGVLSKNKVQEERFTNIKPMLRIDEGTSLEDTRVKSRVREKNDSL